MNKNSADAAATNDQSATWISRLPLAKNDPTKHNESCSILNQPDDQRHQSISRIYIEVYWKIPKNLIRTANSILWSKIFAVFKGWIIKSIPMAEIIIPKGCECHLMQEDGSILVKTSQRVQARGPALHAMPAMRDLLAEV